MVEKYQGTQEMRSKEQGGDGRQKSTKNQTTRTHTRLLAHTAPTACDIVFITHRSSKDHPEEMVEKYDGTQEEGSKQPARGRRTSKIDHIPDTRNAYWTSRARCAVGLRYCFHHTDHQRIALQKWSRYMKGANSKKD